MVFSERTLGSRSLLKSAVSQRETSAVTAFWRDRRRGFGLPRRSISGAERRGGRLGRLLGALGAQLRDAEQIVGGASEHEQPIYLLQPA